MKPGRWATRGLCAGLLVLAGATPARQVCDTREHALSSPTSRFEDHGDGTVTDTESKLMWMRCTVGQTWASGRCTGTPSRHVWLAAQAVADDVNRRGSHFFNDWRLPSLRELATIAERQCRAPRVNLDVFPGTPAAAYWTASSRVGAGTDLAAFALGFGSTGIQYQDKAAAHHVRLVRNAP